MKRFRTLTSILLVLTLVLSLSVTAFAKTGLQVELGAKAGELQNGDMQFVFNALTVKQDGKTTILDPFGVNRLGRSFDDVKHYGKSDELIIVTDYSRMPNALSLVKADGTVLIEDAAIIKSFGTGFRYATVSYATDVVDSKEDCFLFSYQPQATIDVRWEPGEADTMYAGYALVYDTQEERFVGDLRIDDSADSFYAVGDNILLQRSGWDNKDELYRPDGSLIDDLENSHYSGAYFVTRVDGEEKWVIRDENYSELFTLDFNPDKVYTGAKVFAKKLEKGYQLVKADGKPCSKMVFEFPPLENGKYLVGYDEKNNHALLTLDGETILDFSDKVKYFNEIVYGFYKLEYQDGKYAAIYPDGKLVPMENYMDSSTLLSFLYKPDRVFLLDEEDYREVNGNFTGLGSLMYTVEKDRKVGLYSLVDGSELLAPNYSKIKYSNGYVYALNGDVYEIYPVTVTG